MRRISRLASGIIGTAVSLGAVAAFAAPVVTITGNSGTLLVTNYSPLTISQSTYANPYGLLPTNPGSPIVTISGSTVQITLTPPVFTAYATDVGGGRDTAEFDGKLDFNIHFDSPVLPAGDLRRDRQLHHQQRQHRERSCRGMVITETDVTGGPSDGGNLLTNFSAGTWSAGLTTAGFATTYSSYHFSIDNSFDCRSTLRLVDCYNQ